MVNIFAVDNTGALEGESHFGIYFHRPPRLIQFIINL
jgi:hypothetical protein